MELIDKILELVSDGSVWVYGITIVVVIVQTLYIRAQRKIYRKEIELLAEHHSKLMDYLANEPKVKTKGERKHGSN